MAYTIWRIPSNEEDGSGTEDLPQKILEIDARDSRPSPPTITGQRVFPDTTYLVDRGEIREETPEDHGRDRVVVQLDSTVLTARVIREEEALPTEEEEKVGFVPGREPRIYLEDRNHRNVETLALQRGSHFFVGDYKLMQEYTVTFLDSEGEM
ncbi:hypothetical protein CMI48_01940 [Candidatus Pacearchaeota archaeon]|jgi:hypothetical protein|nr:hypothetical protein [Candidatus Pacearchaeota archaeon]|tara:strand:- start:224 stop:682 length:459 start_codon:yes stop_codon:yes gene_type:complete